MKGGLVTLTVVAAALLAFAYPLFIAPQFKLMFSDFASELPKLTRFALKRWFGPAVASPSLILLALASLEPPASPKARNYVVGAFFLAAAAVVLVIAAIYLPIFQMAGNLRAA